MANQIVLGKKHKVLKNVPTPDGMLYEGEIVKVTSLENDRVRVTDELGRIYYISHRAVELIT
tara:strand:+ start:503 stop:688 length:186 start_codon:yes stop_codon:yes gene_type:complete